MERTEAQILAKAPIKVQFGEKEYEISPLTIGKARAWRELAVKTVAEIANVHQQECGDNKAFTHGLAFFFVLFPEKILELVLAYAPNLDRATIESEATDEQLSLALGEIVKVAYPFTRELGTMSHAMGIAASFPQSGKSTR